MSRSRCIKITLFFNIFYTFRGVIIVGYCLAPVISVGLKDSAKLIMGE